MTRKQAPEPGSPIASDRTRIVLSPEAQRAEVERVQAQLDADERERAEKYGDPDKPKRPKMTPEEQSAEFEKVAREHDAEGDEAEFNDVLRKLARPTGAKTR